MPIDNLRLSSVFINMQFAFMVVPMTSIYGLSTQSSFFMLLISTMHVMQSILFRIKTNIPRIKIDNQNSSKIFKIFLFILIIFTLLIAIKANGVPNLDALNFNLTYVIRESIKEPFPINYTATWIAKVICPFFIALYYYKKRYLMMIPFIIIEFIFFLIFTHKTYLFVSIMVLVVMFAHKRGRFIEKMYVFLGVAALTTTLIYLFKGSQMLVTMFPRRVLYVPAILKFQYYDFFSVNPKVFFADGIIGKLLGVDSPYQRSVGYTIAYEFFGVESMANTGYWGDAYANMGVLGVILFSIVLVLIVKYIEINTNNLNISFVISSTFFSFYILNDGALLTNLLTGGQFLLMIMLTIENSCALKERDIIPDVKNGS